jgi:hypothetical protein
MSTCSKSFGACRLITLMFGLFVILLIPGETQAQAPQLHVFVGDTTGPSGQQNSVITVFADNWADTISAFEMWLILDNIEIMYFQSGPVEQIDTTWWICLVGAYPECDSAVSGHPDTLYFQCLDYNEDPPYECLDSIRVMGDEDPDMTYPPEYDHIIVDTTYPVIGQIDTVGTLIGGWEQVLTRSFTAEANDMKITARANASFTDGHTTPGIPQGQQGEVLFRLLGDIKDIPDTATERSVRINVLSSPADNFVFSRPNGTQIGLAYHQIIDTNMFLCEQWDPIFPDTCLKWIKVPHPPYDSIEVKPDSTPYVDSMYVDSLGLHGTVWIEHGSLTVPVPPPAICGNVNMSEDGKVTLGDITQLIDHVYISKAPLEVECTGNTNCLLPLKITLSDITTLIDHVYISKANLCYCCGSGM